MFVVLGLGAIIGGSITGITIDKTSIKMANFVNIIFTALALVLLITFVLKEKFNYFIYPLLFLWGVQDTGCNTIINTVLGFEFESKSAPFGAYRVIRNPIISLISFIQGFFIITPNWEVERGMVKER